MSRLVIYPKQNARLCLELAETKQKRGLCNSFWWSRGRIL